MPDKQLTCVDCKKPFVYPEAMEKKLRDLVAKGEIDAYNEPKRCAPCRAVKKQRNKSQGS